MGTNCVGSLWQVRLARNPNFSEKLVPLSRSRYRSVQLTGIRRMQRLFLQPDNVSELLLLSGPPMEGARSRTSWSYPPTEGRRFMRPGLFSWRPLRRWASIGGHLLWADTRHRDISSDVPENYWGAERAYLGRLIFRLGLWPF